MGYERFPRGSTPQDDYYGRRETQDRGRDDGAGRGYGYYGARDDAGNFGRDDDRGYGQRDYGYSGYGSVGRDDDRASFGRGSDDRGRYGQGGVGQSGYGQDSYGRDRYGAGDRSDYGNQSRYARGDEFHGSYASDRPRWQETDRDRGQQRDWRGGQDRFGGRPQGQGYGRAPQGYDYQDRGFIARAGDEVRSWFGDEEAERRREADSRYDERYYNQQGERDGDYHNWRSGQIAALDRDYDEYRRENRSKFENEFSTWRSGRQSQRDLLNNVKEHADVVGSDGAHVGTVDKVRGDRILLTKNDADAGGQHHSIPSSWLTNADETKVTLNKTADEAKRHWRTEEENKALFGYGDRGRDASASKDDTDGEGRILNRSFPGTY